MSFEHPQPRFGGRVPVAQRLRRARRHRSRQGRRAGPDRADRDSAAAAGLGRPEPVAFPSGCKAIPPAEAGRY